ncbi:mitochondrial pyruvate carrier 3 isoform X1 [Monomorium pharaonis]|uniref:mitochondrial pyruvate carrier 3 isoform X1 n=1 Tax=Monomorium pharaonis TaxID=307658 RepID=UPI00102E1106|nr:mitochondrial pyruvate carrier 3 isoform X1 [Monomorium pharaonis]
MSEAPDVTWFSRQTIPFSPLSEIDDLDRLLCGPQTIFFWAPAFKWGLVIAGLGDLQRPANKISVSQSCALGITGLIWTRYSLAITPKNWSLFSVNLFVAFTAIYQITRAMRYQRQEAALEAAKTSPSAAH